MEFPFDVQRLLGGSKLAVLTSASVAAVTSRRGAGGLREDMAAVVDGLGRASAKVCVSPCPPPVPSPCLPLPARVRACVRWCALRGCSAGGPIVGECVRRGGSLHAG